MTDENEVLKYLIAGAIIGINDDLKVYSGYDSYHPEANAVKDAPMYEGHEIPELMLKEERIKIADAMIVRWAKYKESLE